MELSKEDQIEYDRIMGNRVRLRCTGKSCDNRSGFWTDKSFKETYLNNLGCQLCGSKHAEELKAVEND